MRHLIDDSYGDVGDIWSTVSEGNIVYFQSRKYLFKYQSGKLTSWEFDTNTYHRIFLINSSLYLRIAGEGLHVLVGSKFQPIPGGEIFSNEFISVMLPTLDGNILIGSRKNGFYELNKSNLKEPIRPIFPELRAIFEKSNIYSGTVQNNGNFAIGTLGGGLYVITPKGVIVQNINNTMGLQSERVYGVYLDKSGALWLSTDNGIAHAETESPLSNYDESFGLIGTVYSLQRHKGILFAAGGSGIFALCKKSSNGEFIPITQSSKQAWSITEFTLPDSKEKVLLAGTNDGVYQIKVKDCNDIEITLIADFKQTIFTVYPSPLNPKEVFIGSIDSVGVLCYKNGAWSKVQAFTHTPGSIRNMTMDRKGELWLGTRYSGVYKTKVDIDSHKINIIKHYKQQDGLPAEHLVEVNSIDNQIIVATPKGVVSYNSETDRFESTTIFGERFAKYRIGVLHTAESTNGNQWIHAIDEKTNREWIEMKIKNPNGSVSFDSVTLKRLEGLETYCLYSENENIFWIGGSEGVFKYNSNEHYDFAKPFHAIIRNVTIGDSVYFGGNQPLQYDYVSNNDIEGFLQDSKSSDILPYSNNSISFSYSAPAYENEYDNQFSHRLLGYQPAQEWSSWRLDNKTEYTNLPEGEYKFFVKSRNIYGKESTIAVYSFEILPPWQRTWWAYIIYSILSFLVVWGIVHLNIRRVRKEKNKLAYLVNKKTKELQKRTSEIEEKNTELAQQKEEIASQRDHLAESFSNIKVLSEIGQDITSTLSLEDLIEKSYKHLSSLMEVSVFGIGFYNENKKIIEFPNAKIFGDNAEITEYSIKNDRKLAVRSFISSEEIFIQHLSKERKKYLDNKGFPQEAAEGVESAIYLPLLSNGKKIGVITIQHNAEYTYQEYHLDLIRNLAVYIGIALNNAETYYQITLKNMEIERVNKEVKDSISYAQRIQGAMLPKIEEIKGDLPQSFILFKPRDIVSGDFYWYSSKRDIMGNQKQIIAAVDCTGHGVPGAFMSTIGIDLLDEIVNLMGIIEADGILNYLHKLVRKALRQDETGNLDGMDMSVCVIDQKRGKMEFAGAKNPLVFIRDGELHQIEGDRRSIGGYVRDQTEERKFTKHVINIGGEKTPTSFYLFSDGYQDQFGGPKRRRFMSKRLRSTLEEIHLLPVDKQQISLERRLATWQGKEDQVDDILIIGFKL